MWILLLHIFCARSARDLHVQFVSLFSKKWFHYLSCRLRFCYNCVINKYLRGFDRKLDISDWQSRVASYSSMMRKLERDWKMVSSTTMNYSVQNDTSSLIRQSCYSQNEPRKTHEWVAKLRPRVSFRVPLMRDYSQLGHVETLLAWQLAYLLAWKA